MCCDNLMIQNTSVNVLIFLGSIRLTYTGAQIMYSVGRKELRRCAEGTEN